jgi:hypothetical protein
MLDPRRWFIAAVIVWGIALLAATIGLVAGVDGLVAFSWLLRRVAFLVTAVWLVFAAVAAGWRKIRRR